MPSNLRDAIISQEALRRLQVEYFDRVINPPVPSAPRANTPVRAESERVIPRDSLGRFAPVRLQAPEVTPNALPWNTPPTVQSKTGIKGWFQRLDSECL